MRFLIVAAMLFSRMSDQNPVVGQWLVSYQRPVFNGTDSAHFERAMARVTLEQRGDSIVGRWLLVSPSAQPMTAPRVLWGVAPHRRFQLSGPPIEGKLINHLFGSTTVMLVPVYDFVVSGDSISGSLYTRNDEHGVKSPPIAFSGVREKK
ncbi:MAG: hypothetical protein JWO05_3566 [Gemmatimonadetes bacterium]|nr:hypothetical protein [Gemmatimonadota bacterium]